jgi:hypothetical protein
MIGQLIAVPGWVSELRDPPSLQQATTTAVTSIAADRTVYSTGFENIRRLQIT